MINPNEFMRETHSELFTRLVRIINEISSGEEYTLLKCLETMRGFDPTDDQRILPLLDALFLFDDEQGETADIVKLMTDGKLTTKQQKNLYAQLRVDLPVPIQPTALELPFLKLMLMDSGADFLLPQQLRDKLLNMLNDVKVPETESYQRKGPLGDNSNDPKLCKILSTFWTALMNHQLIYYENVTDSGTVYKGKIAPVRLEYDSPSGRYSLITWDEQTQRAIKMSVRNIQTLKLVPEPLPEDLQEKFLNFLHQRRREFILKIENKNNAVERCFTMFATNDKDAYYDEASDTYTLTVKYYEFEYNDMLDRVISLGSSATLIKPADMRNAVIDWARSSLMLYEK